jgi:hypothetical protein
MLHVLTGVDPSVRAHDRSSTQHDASEPPGTDDSFGDVGGSPATSAFRASGSVIPRALPNSPRRGFLALRARRSVGLMSARAGVLPRRRRARPDRFTPEPAVPLGRLPLPVWEAAVRSRLLPGRQTGSGAGGPDSDCRGLIGDDCEREMRRHRSRRWTLACLGTGRVSASRSALLRFVLRDSAGLDGAPHSSACGCANRGTRFPVPA